MRSNDAIAPPYSLPPVRGGHETDGYFLVLGMVKVSCIQEYYISAHIKRRYAEFLLVDMPLLESDNFKVSVLISKYISKESHTNKLEVLNQCWFNVGPPSMTLVQH